MFYSLTPLEYVISVFIRFRDVLRTLAESDEGKLHILRVMYEVWKNHSQVRMNIYIVPPSLPSSLLFPLSLLPYLPWEL